MRWLLCSTFVKPVTYEGQAAMELEPKMDWNPNFSIYLSASLIHLILSGKKDMYDILDWEPMIEGTP